MPLPAAMDAALRGPSPLVFTAAKIELPSRTLRLLDCSAVLTVNGEAFAGEDDAFGSLGAVESVSDGLGNEAPTLRLLLLPRSNVATAEAAAPTAQGSPVTIWFGVVTNPTTGATVTGDPVFVGELDTARLSVGESRALQLDVVSAWERLFDGNEGARLNPSFWNTIWPTDRALDLVHTIVETQPWGASDGGRPVYTTQGGGLSNGGYSGPDLSGVGL